MALTFGWTKTVAKKHKFQDSLRFHKDGTIELWCDRACFPLVHISTSAPTISEVCVPCMCVHVCTCVCLNTVAFG